MGSRQQILSNLRVMMEAHHPLDLLVNIEGVAFGCQANILEITKNQVKLQAHNPVIAGLSEDDSITVMGSDYFEPAMARVLSIDLLTDCIVLGGFTITGAKPGERNIARLEPKTHLVVELDNQGQISTGALADISINGAGVRILHSDYKPTLKPGTMVALTIHLPKKQAKTRGTILSSQKTAEHYRLSVRFEQDFDQKLTIFQYMVDRRAEIQTELNRAYKSASQGRAKG